MKRVRVGNQPWKQARILAAVLIAALWAAIPLLFLAPPSTTGQYLVISLALAAMACGILAALRGRFTTGVLCIALACVSAVLTLRLDMLEGHGLTLFALVYGLAMISLSQLCRAIGETAEVEARRTNRQNVANFSMAGDTSGFVGNRGVAHDITSNQHAGHRAKDSQEPAEAENQRTLKFLQDVIHEVKLPLTTILGFAEILQSPAARDLPEYERQTYRQLLLDHCRQLTSFVTDAGDMARIDTNHFQLFEQEVDAADLAEIAMKSCQAVVEESDAAVLVNVIENIELRCDAVRIRRVLETLVTRAVKAGGAGCRVDVRFARQTGGGLEISVLDHGPALAPGEIARAFEPSLQERGVEGLSLPVARQIALLHGGNLTVEAFRDDSMIARLTLPASRVSWKAAAELETVRAA